MTPTVPPGTDLKRLKVIYKYAETSFRYTERHCHDDVEPAQATQRDITRWSFEVMRGVRPDVQPFTNLLIQFPEEGEEAPDQLAPDNTVFVHAKPLKIKDSFNTPVQPVGPFLVLDYVSKERQKNYEARQAKYEKELQVPYYLLFYPDAEEMTLFHLGEKKYVSVKPNAAKRYEIPELELEVGLLDKWIRYWFRGELVPLPGELLNELAKLREELAKGKGQQP